MKYYFHPEAKKEFLEAINFYETRSTGLGLEFADEIYATILRIVHFPTAWSRFSENTRRCLAKRFPFGIVYQITDNKEIVIIAVMQLNRKPGYWKNRAK